MDDWIIIFLCFLTILVTFIALDVSPKYEGGICPEYYHWEWVCDEYYSQLIECKPDPDPDVVCKTENNNLTCKIITSFCNNGTFYPCKCEIKQECLRGHYECVRGE